MRISAIVKHNKASIYRIVFAKQFNLVRVRVTAKMACGLKNGNIVRFVQMVGKRVACNAAANNRNLHCKFSFRDSRISMGTVRKFQISPQAASSLRP